MDVFFPAVIYPTNNENAVYPTIYPTIYPTNNENAVYPTNT
jgi:hypothetical protein